MRATAVFLFAFFLLTARVGTCDTIGSALLDRAVTDIASGQVYIFDGDSFDPANRIHSFSFFEDPSAGGTRYITPILFENTVSGSNPGDDVFVVRGVGTGRTITTSGTFTFDFGLIYGSDLVLSGHYTFGFVNALLNLSGGQVVNSVGVVEFDVPVSAGPGVSGTGTNAWRFTPTVAGITISIGSIFGNGGFLLNDRSVFFNLDRTYSALASTAPVPEPSSTTLVGIGLLGRVAWGWLRRRNSSAGTRRIKHEIPQRQGRA